MDSKKVSAIMAVYNREKFLKEAIDSVINQTYDNWELILVNDASTDDSHSICSYYKKKYPNKIKYINVEENKGAGNSFYTGTINASGDYLAFIGSDDIQIKDKFKIGVEFLNNNLNVDLLFHNYETMNEAGVRTGRNLILPYDINDNNKLLDYSLRRNYMYSGLAIIRNSKDIVFDRNLRLSEDYDLFLKLVYNGHKAAFFSEVLALNRIHNGNISSNYKESNEAVKYILGKYDFKDLSAKLKKQGISDNRMNNTLGIVNIILENFKEALNFFTMFNFDNCAEEDYCDNLFYSATAYYNLKDYVRSGEQLKKVLCKRPKEAAIYNNIAVIKSNLADNIEEVEELLKSALKLQPLYMDAKINLEDLNKRLPLQHFTSKFLRKNLVHEKNAVL